MLRFSNAPARIAKLPISDRGFPIPYFAAEVDGVRDFRVVTPEKMVHAIRHRKCWVCGEPLGRFMAFVIGPMCAINRTISDPPSHRECAIFSAESCPFLSRPMAKRREMENPSGFSDAAGLGLKRNPGAVGVWVTKDFRVFRPHAGNAGILFEMGDPVEVLWFAEGQPASADAVRESIRTGLPHLLDLAEKDGPEGVAELHRRVDAVQPLLPRAA